MENENKCSLCDETENTVLCNDMHYYCPVCLKGMIKAVGITPIKITYHDKTNFTDNLRRLCGNDPSEEDE